MYSIVYFSPTGNTKFLANQLKNNLGDNKTQLIDMIFCNPKKLQKNDKFIIMFSIHAFNAPREVISFINLIPEGLFKNINIIAVGCNETWLNEAASLKLRKTLENKGYSIGVDRVISMPLTFIMDFPIDTKRTITIEAKNKIKTIANDLKTNKIDEKLISNKAKSLRAIGNFEKYAAKFFGLELHANKNCISCGLCWKQCPSKNISEKNGKPKFGFNCSMCMRCIYKCPVHAISPRISKFIPIKGGYCVRDY